MKPAKRRIIFTYCTVLTYLLFTDLMPCLSSTRRTDSADRKWRIK